MAEPFKNFFSPDLVDSMARHLQRVHPEFDRRRFVAAATGNLDALELKQRSAQIQSALGECLPADFANACEVMLAALHPHDGVTLAAAANDESGIRGWAVMPMADFVAERGLHDFDRSMNVLKAFTRRFSAEFAVRPFLLADPQRALAYLRNWCRDPNRHVRRLASEGSRPRLPWGVRLPMFVRDPAPLLPLLESLRDDPEEYVRLSVANSLNDIAKDHPDTVAELAGRWLANAPPPRRRLVRHACRTLLKQGHPQALAALGYRQAQVAVEQFAIRPRRVRLGESLALELTLRSSAEQPQQIMLDYVVHHRRANGALSPKVFKWKTFALAAGETLHLTKKHSMRAVTTRRYYPGRHRVEVQVNGKSLGGAAFDLRLADG